jgi:hypothetical protein
MKVKVVFDEQGIWLQLPDGKGDPRTLLYGILSALNGKMPLQMMVRYVCEMMPGKEIIPPYVDEKSVYVPGMVVMNIGMDAIVGAYVRTIVIMTEDFFENLDGFSFDIEVSTYRNGKLDSDPLTRSIEI